MNPFENGREIIHEQDVVFFIEHTGIKFPSNTITLVNEVIEGELTEVVIFV
jgi:hypothetical protein